MVLSSLHFLDYKGRVLISRDYRGDISADHAEGFIDVLAEREVVDETEEPADAGGPEQAGNFPPPVLTKNGITYCYIKYNNLYLMAMTRRNSNVFIILQFLHKVIQVFKEYFWELEEESLRDNFVVVYELLDEMMDFGYPQLTETKILKEYITQQSFQLQKQTRSQQLAGDHQLSGKTPSVGTGVVSWRQEGIKYRKNEVFLDVIESVNLTVNGQGQVVKNEVLGQVKIRCYLSGMPELRLGLNDKVLLEVRNNVFTPSTSASPTSSPAPTPAASHNTNTQAVELEHVKFHQCVRLARFEQDRTISFVPPDGDFELLSYHVTPRDPAADLRPLFWVDCRVEKFTESTVEYTVTVRSQYKRRSAANNVVILVPVPADADTPRLKATLGTAEYAPELAAIRWSIGFFPGGKEFSLRVKMGLPVIKTAAAGSAATLARPISLSFSIPYYTMSGIQVRYLKIVEKTGYPALPWVRYITQSGDYHFRMPELYQ